MQCRSDWGEYPLVDDLDVHGVFVPGHCDVDRVILRRLLERIRDRFGGRLSSKRSPRVEPALLRDALHGRAKLSRGRRPAVERQIDLRSLSREKQPLRT